MSIWARLLKLLRLPDGKEKRSFDLDEGVLQSLRLLAEHEKRPPNEVARSLLARAIEERQNNIDCLARWKNLTPREQQVTALICLNYTTPQIAARLDISSETVKTHAHNAFNKFNVRNRQELRQVMAGWDFADWEETL
jgi:DNA-binding NarL/FixJ family response regulator